MPLKLSYSQVSKFGLCPKSYEYHYVKRIRPNVTHTALIFGSALDSALNDLLTGKDTAEVTFENSFTNTEINNIKVYIPTHENMVYANSDFDSDLLTENDFTFIETLIKDGRIQRYTDYLSTYKTLSEKKKSSGFDSLSIEEKRFYNLLNWLSLRRKGFLMLESYRKKVLPKIEKVHAVQQYVDLENQEGDKITGYVDLIADIKGYGTVILDNKTSAREYDDDSVLTSPQLSLYLHILEDKFNTRKAGYIVMNKSVIKNRKKICSVCDHDGSGKNHKTCPNEINNKRCGGAWNETLDPEIFIQLIIDDIPQQTENIVLENMDNTCQAIKHGVFSRNFTACKNTYGGLCPYFNLCFKNSSVGLLELPKGVR